MSSETATSPNIPGDFGHSGRYFRGGTTYLPAALYGGEVVGSGRSSTSPAEGSGEVGRFGPITPPADLDPDDTTAFREWWKDVQRQIADGDLKPKVLDLPERPVKALTQGAFQRIPRRQQGTSA